MALEIAIDGKIGVSTESKAKVVLKQMFDAARSLFEIFAEARRLTQEAHDAPPQLVTMVRVKR